MKHSTVTAATGLLLASIALVALGCSNKSDSKTADKSADNPGAKGTPNNSGASDTPNQSANSDRVSCLEAEAGGGVCWDYPAPKQPDRAATQAEICTNSPGATWHTKPCPRQDSVGACMSNNQYDKGAPIKFFYKTSTEANTPEAVRERCAATNKLYVAP